MLGDEPVEIRITLLEYLLVLSADTVFKSFNAKTVAFTVSKYKIQLKNYLG